MNVNISNGFIFSEVNGAMNRSGCLAKSKGLIHFSRYPLRFIAP